MSKGVVLLFLFAAGLIILTLLIVALASARQKAAAAGHLPPSRRPGPTDEALEGRSLEGYQAAGVVLTVLLTVLLPFLYVHEPTRQREASAKEVKESVTLGRQVFQTFCARCHGIDANGGVVKRYVIPGVKGAKPQDYPAPNLHEIWQRHQGQDVAQIAWQTIQQGRPPSPMPAWGVRYGGAMNDQQITNLVNYLLSIQSDNKKRPEREFSALGTHEVLALERAIRAGQRRGAPTGRQTVE
ncbi:MAG TPA: cytochrome c [Actinomycetes bacterium]|jgi:mono/diheme cytochrome c family protein|nr:cytochrome c [Actinomycetes bacterium]